MRIRTISIIAAAIGIFMAVGCKKESEGITLGASIANDDNLTKVHLSTTDQPLWDNGDPVWVNGDDTRTISDITDGTNAKIKGVTTSSSYLAIYPADMAAGTASNASIIIPAMPYLLSFAAGAMVYVVVEELIPEMSEGEHSNIGVVMFAVGFTLMMALDVALG